MRYRWLLVLFTLVVALSVLPAAGARAVGDARCFPETGQCIMASFRRFWEQNGGQAIFGLPIQQQIATTINGRPATSQLFERARFEQYLDVRFAPVMLGLIGVEALALRGIDWREVPPTYDPNAVARGDCRLYTQTNHATCYAFRDFFDRNGGVRIFGLPIGDEFVEGDRVIQWYERARFEAGTWPGAGVELALLGWEVYY
jgi:hypothetical protein